MPVLFVGLGNPGSKYEMTRHNVGFMFVNRLASFLGIKKWQERFNGLVASINNESLGKIVLLKPQTFMNSSGKSVLQCMSFFKVTPKQIIVIHDELDQKIGVPKLKLGGSPRGHNGLRNINQTIGRDDYTRIMIGIDRPQNKDDIINYVVSDFSDEDLKILYATFNTIIENLSLLLSDSPKLST